ncbi:hypothetical protein CEXT_413121 [Caerostris extrusa]|uniref:Uncharacterized protein n=1 Tax=Caerostris extrusa TaxID=172846 RepID=A0AAV4T200_CAEEX|nr:hypothetical protein CEXT_413121 [Caerostris extrusa]
MKGTFAFELRLVHREFVLILISPDYPLEFAKSNTKVSKPKQPSPLLLLPTLDFCIPSLDVSKTEDAWNNWFSINNEKPPRSKLNQTRNVLIIMSSIPQRSFDPSSIPEKKSHHSRYTYSVYGGSVITSQRIPPSPLHTLSFHELLKRTEFWKDRSWAYFPKRALVVGGGGISLVNQDERALSLCQSERSSLSQLALHSIDQKEPEAEEEMGALLPAVPDAWPHHLLSYTEVPVSTALHSAAIVHPALHAQLPVS